jgi:hypothetical protein
MSKTDAIEGARTDCLHRCCKDLGIGTQVWDKPWILEWIAEYAEPYTGSVYDWRTKSNKNKVLWRRKGEPLFGEALATAVSIAGEFPVGFGPESVVVDGPAAGKKIMDLEDAALKQLERATLVEWRLAAKAEQVRRLNAAILAAQQGTGGADSVDGVLGATSVTNAN